MPFHPLLVSLQRHKLTVSLLTLQIAMTFAIICNVGFLIAGRVESMSVVTGVDESNVVVIESTRTLPGNALTAQQVDLRTLRGIPGVQAAVALDAVPLGRYMSMTGARSTPKGDTDRPQITICLYDGSPGELAALGLRLTAGRDFAPSEYLPLDALHRAKGMTQVTNVIVSQAVADKLWPGVPALGKTIYVNDSKGYRVTGVVAHLARPSLGKPSENEYSVLLPLLVDGKNAMYTLRTTPDQRDRVLREAVDRLNAVDDERIIGKARLFDEVRREYFQHDVTMLGLLVTSALGLLFVTGLGVAGLASFWVQQRYRQIGIRRAVGATRRDILRHFQYENALIVTVGLVLGAILAILLNQLLMKHYELPRLPWPYLPITGLGLLLLGQLAVWSPARRAAAIPPVSAIRSA
jgi:putative ABC transport system permease protein